MARVARAHGALVIDKPLSWTSHDVVAKARGIYGQRRIGHGGTLDPMASGVLILLLGEATKLSPYVAGATKVYDATLDFGYSTATLDADGSETARSELHPGWLTLPALERALEAERQRSEQVPPAYSAIKLAGQKAYAMARRGEAPELLPRPVTVHGLEILDVNDSQARVRLRVSKGYYVRSFARDVCTSLGIEGHLGALRRTQSGPFHLAQASAWPLTEVAPLIGLPELARCCLPSAVLSDEGTTFTGHGKPLLATHFVQLPQAANQGEPFAWFSNAGQLLAIGSYVGEDVFRVLRGFRQPDGVPQLEHFSELAG